LFREGHEGAQIGRKSWRQSGKTEILECQNFKNQTLFICWETCDNVVFKKKNTWQRWSINYMQRTEQIEK
jgi:hypothetical protein